MKKIYKLLIAGLVLPLFLSAQTRPGPLTVNKYLCGATIDADTTDPVWSKIKSQPIEQMYLGNVAAGKPSEVSGFTGPVDLTASFRSFYNDTAIYFLFVVKDDVVTQATNGHWLGDKVEIYFGLPSYDSTIGACGSHSRQFAFSAKNEPTLYLGSGVWCWQYPNATDPALDGLEYAFNETSNGYIMEVSINKYIALEDLDYFVSNSIAFDIDIADNDEFDPAAGIRYRKLWHNNGTGTNELWNLMSDMGVMKFGSEIDCIVSDLKLNSIPAKTYGDVFTIAATSSLSDPITYSSSNSSVASIMKTTSSVYVYANKAGTVTITATQGGVSVSQQLTIGKAPLTITANDTTKKSGEKNPSFTASYTGFKNGDDASVFITPLKLACTADGTSQDGVYKIIPYGASADNYTMVFVEGVLIVIKSNTSLSSLMNDIEVYPNPTTDYVNIKSIENESVSIQLLDITGQVLIERLITNGVLDVQGLLAGIYILKVNNEVFKLIKQ